MVTVSVMVHGEYCGLYVQWCAILCFALKVVTRTRILIFLCQRIISIYIYIYIRERDIMLLFEILPLETSF